MDSYRCRSSATTLPERWSWWSRMARCYSRRVTATPTGRKRNRCRRMIRCSDLVRFRSCLRGRRSCSSWNKENSTWNASSTAGISSARRPRDRAVVRAADSSAGAGRRAAPCVVPDNCLLDHHADGTATLSTHARSCRRSGYPAPCHADGMRVHAGVVHRMDRFVDAA
jgi:hypothetical protein